MSYFVIYAPKAEQGLKRLLNDEPNAYQKALRLIAELYEHPRTGTGHPEQLSSDRDGQWSRRITKKHRLVYEIHDDKVIVLVLSAYGHYDDK